MGNHWFSWSHQMIFPSNCKDLVKDAGTYSSETAGEPHTLHWFSYIRIIPFLNGRWMKIIYLYSVLKSLPAFPWQNNSQKPWHLFLPNGLQMLSVTKLFTRLNHWVPKRSLLIGESVHHDDAASMEWLCLLISVWFVYALPNGTLQV